MKPTALRVINGRESSAPPSGGADEDTPLVDPEISRALQDVIGRFDAFIRRTASRHGLAGSDLDDVVQDLTVRIWRSFGTSDLIRRAKATYMYRAAVSASLDLIRRRRATRAHQMTALDSAPNAALVDRSVDAEQRLAVSDLSRQVHEALACLPESRRAIVRLYLSGYDRFEIANLLGWTEAKTRNLLYRGLGDLRGVLTSRGIAQEHTR